MTTHGFGHWFFCILWIWVKTFPLIGAGIIVFLMGFLIFKNAGQPYDLMAGWPVMLLGASVVLINLYEALAGILDSRENLLHCPICNPPNGGV